MGGKSKSSARRSARRVKRAAGLVGTSFGSVLPTNARRMMKRLPLRARLLILIPLISMSLASVAVAALLVFYTIAFPDPLSLRAGVSGPVIRILARDGSVLTERGAAHDYMPLDLLPDRVIQAVVATEDRRFWSHWGLDPSGLVRAALANMRAGRVAQGGSTLTQQLAKNLFLSPERTLGRKVEELVLAFWLELRLSKREILELYLNRVYFGGGAYGIEAAAQRYFDRSARELSLAQAAVIAGLLKAPSRFAPTANPRLAIARAHVVLGNMTDAGYITPQQERKARSTRLVFANIARQREREAADYAIDYVLDRLPPILGEGYSEVIVDTSIDRNLQRRASSEVAAAITQHGEALSASQAAVVVLDTDGGIRALVGGRSYGASQFNRAVKARRQPGSAFKPFVYLAALEAGYTPESVAYDLPFNLNGWSPKNDNGRFTGPVTLRQAMAQSINTVAVRLMMDVGPERVASLARRLGLESDLRADPSLALGTSEVSLLELTGAYGAFATGGRGIEPHIVRRIRSNSGRVLYARPAPGADQLAAPAAVAQLNDMLAATVRNGTGRRAQLDQHPVAGKTGTSQDFRDAWFVGYTAHFVGGVWVGNDNGRTMNRVTGGHLPAEIWRKVMIAAHEDKTPAPLPGAVPTPGSGTDFDALSLNDTPVATPKELLPWRMPTSVPPRRKDNQPAERKTEARPANASPGPRQPARAYPTEQISEDFLQRVLNEGGGSTPKPEVAENEMASPSRAPLPGMMTLGRGLSE